MLLTTKIWTLIYHLILVQYSFLQKHSRYTRTFSKKEKKNTKVMGFAHEVSLSSLFRIHAANKLFLSDSSVNKYQPLHQGWE